MKSKAGRMIIFTLCCLTFACLFISGAERLIERGEKAPRLPEIRHVVTAYLTSSQTHAEHAEHHAPGETQAERKSSCTLQEEAQRIEHALLRTDANGNILGSRSYIRAVYHVFPLSDGFA